MPDAKKPEPKKNMGASVRARLLAIATAKGQVFDLVLNRYAVERLLYRLSVSPHAERFVLKGATLLMTWLAAPHRGTRDLDLLGFGDALEPGPETLDYPVLLDLPAPKLRGYARESVTSTTSGYSAEPSRSPTTASPGDLDLLAFGDPGVETAKSAFIEGSFLDKLRMSEPRNTSWHRHELPLVRPLALARCLSSQR
jgi:Nucleotidyl transferase AbiEii toxin, Type IV TA system